MARLIHVIAFPRARGLSLVELMVAMVIGLILIGGVIHVFLGSHQTYRSQQALSQLQDAGRSSLQMITYDARMAGLTGCRTGARINNLLDETDQAYDPDLFDTSRPFQSADMSDSGFDVQGDVLSISMMRALPINLVASGSGPGSANNIPPIVLNNQESDSPHVPQGTIVMVADDSGTLCDLFQQTTTATANNLQRATGGQSPGNKNRPDVNADPDLSYSNYSGAIQVFQPSRITYFVAPTQAGSSSVGHSLYRIDGGNAEEVALGIRNMQVEFALDRDRDGLVDSDFIRAGAMDSEDWRYVAAVRVHLLAYSASYDNVSLESGYSVSVGDHEFTASDRRYYQVFTTTVGVRNRLK
ncbi:PilW family protein [Ectothiorhodospira haloalkaliphila]|uniref:PilW family protein n=1 Tax=Ectothiorhodospira haloalkaliphila TaxID=421628 RepID=UPI000A00B3D8|nr:PilW family protein [Ectothiorhodospira haloalkaliphila]